MRTRQRVGTGTYAGTIRQAMAYQRVSIQGLRKATGNAFSYEHLRKVIAGHPVASRACNAVICKALELDEPELWAMAVRDKDVTRLGALGVRLHFEGDDELAEVWPHLTEAERARLRRIAEGWLAMREA